MRFALKGVALATVLLWGSHAAALGLGRLTVMSSLGETLRAEVEVSSITPEEAASLVVRVASPDAYRAAGVEYNAVLPSASVQLVRRPDGRSVLRVSSERAVLEPFVDVIIEATWASGRLVREYTLLFDPPGSRSAQAAAPATAPIVSPAPPMAAPAPAPATAFPTPAPAPMQAPAAPVAPAAPAPRAAPPVASPVPQAAAPAPRPAVVAAPRPRDINDYRVKRGDNLTRIAERTQRQGVSLDQMLVSLFRANPQAFMADNMNRMRSGAVLSVPSQEEVAKVDPGTAREVIVAQSIDFDAYRQRLAGNTTTTADNAPTRQAAGTVQTQVEDRRQAAATTPDRLTLSQGAAAAASAAEAKLSQETERRAADARLAELSRNVQDLKKLQGAVSAAAPAVAVAQAPAAPVPAPPPAAPPPPAPTPPAPTPPAAVTAPPVVAQGPAAESPSFMDSLSENSLLLPAAGVLVALLGLFGLYRLRNRMRKPVGETSFLESRLQPDSFFGASGGQRVDTRETASATSSASSMSYSLSQLDAIGDVDPVAEADVYLAYGRDLQAEEILKEAMRATPERLAIRTKLLEVYAKRRDTKGFELLATQLFNLTRGGGEDWSKAQEMGRSIDPDNPLYLLGGSPEEVQGIGGQPVEALGASTVPYTAQAPAAFQPAVDATLDNDGLDLDLDLPLGDDPPVHEKTHALGTDARYGVDDMLEMDGSNTKTLPLQRSGAEAAAKAKAQAAAADNGLDFDLGDLGTESKLPQAEAIESEMDFNDFALDEPQQASGNVLDPADPLMRKLELAEEFRQIGDLEGARDLLEEVVNKANGTLKSKAQGMLEQLG